MERLVDEEWRENADLRKRLTKTLQYGEWPKTDRPSFALTKLLVNFFLNCVRKEQRGQATDSSLLNACANLGLEACISPQAAVVAVIYCRRHVENDSHILKIISPVELILISALVASKYLYDFQGGDGVYNDEWATVAEKQLKVLNRLELLFLEDLDWTLHVTENEFEQTLAQVERAVAFSEGESRGWFTTQEMKVLLSSEQMTRTLLVFFIEAIPAIFGCAALYAFLFCPVVYLFAEGLVQVSCAVGLARVDVNRSIAPLLTAEIVSVQISSAPFRHFEPPLGTASQWSAAGQTVHLVKKDRMPVNVTAMGDLVLQASLDGSITATSFIEWPARRCVCCEKRGLRIKSVELRDAVVYRGFSCGVRPVLIPST